MLHLPAPPARGAFEFLSFTTSAGANIAFIDFDDKGRRPDRLTVSLNLEETAVIDHLLDLLKSRYRLEDPVNTILRENISMIPYFMSGMPRKYANSSGIFSGRFFSSRFLLKPIISCRN